MKEGQRLEIAYPSSDDVMWFRAPKPEKGDRAVFLLHQRGLEERDVAMLAIVEPRRHAARRGARPDPELIIRKRDLVKRLRQRGSRACHSSSST